ncbi:cobalt transporter CbiM [Antarctobacter jejuensis]|uniref:cobalt transporter CbiM n=1 Tax=Antarctobacter jejuensis TaxID=1439938 RepID=UPI003FD6118E
MHIVDGALSTPVLIGGAVAAAGGIALGLRALPLERIPAAGVLSAAFFVASLIHVPIGPSSVHLILNGLAGLILGWAAFPALFVGLILQAVFFGFGGLSVLGVNAVNIALPAVLIGVLLRPFLTRVRPPVAAVLGGIGGALSIALTTLFVALSLMFSGDEFLAVAHLVFVAHLPIMAIEGLLTGFAVLLAAKVKPDLFTALEETHA